MKLPPKYLRGYRRLAMNDRPIEQGKCWTCLHALGLVTWWCDRLTAGLDCKWVQCVRRSNLSWSQRRFLDDRWIGLPPNEEFEGRIPAADSRGGGDEGNHRRLGRFKP